MSARLVDMQFARAQNAFELSLALAKDRFNRIRMVCSVADKSNDKDTIYFLSRLLEEEVGSYVLQPSNVHHGAVAKRRVS